MDDQKLEDVLCFQFQYTVKVVNASNAMQRHMSVIECHRALNFLVGMKDTVGVSQIPFPDRAVKIEKNGGNDESEESEESEGWEQRPLSGGTPHMKRRWSGDNCERECGRSCRDAEAGGDLAEGTYDSEGTDDREKAHWSSEWIRFCVCPLRFKIKCQLCRREEMVEFHQVQFQCQV